MKLAERHPLLHLPDRWDWASITMQFQSQLPADRLVSSTHAVPSWVFPTLIGPIDRISRIPKGWLWGWADAEIVGPPSLAVRRRAH